MHFYSSLHCDVVNQVYFATKKPREILFYSRNTQTTTFRYVFHEKVAYYNKNKFEILKYERKHFESAETGNGKQIKAATIERDEQRNNTK